MFYLGVTRFNNITWLEKERWIENNKIEGCFYNCPIKIKENIPLEIDIYIIEMNNDKNLIMGIGKIKNKTYNEKKNKIYTDNNYNRYSYKSKYYISREEILNKNEKNLLDAIEKFLFKGYKHMKRGQGITILPIDHQIRFSRYVDDLFIT